MMMNLIKPFVGVLKTALFLIVLIQLQGCTMGGQFLKEADTANNVTKDEIIVVGTIVVTPKIADDEQSLKPSGTIMLFDTDQYYKNRAMIQFNNKPEASDYKSVITPELGKTFFYKISRDMKYMVDGSVVMELGRRGVSGKIVLPTWFRLDIKPSDKAIYIGKIIYKRDDFNSVTDMKLVDDYKNAAKQFRKKFGSKYKLKKSMIKKI